MGGKKKGEAKKKEEEEEEEVVEVEDEVEEGGGEEEEGGEEGGDKENQEEEEEEAKAPASKKAAKRKAAETEAPAPKKGKGAKGGGGDDEDDDDGGGGDAHSQVLSYLRRANRPYSAPVLYENFHHEIGKAALQRILEDLTAKTKLTKKEFGKAVLYWITQADSADVGPEVLRQLDQQSTEVRWTEKLNGARVTLTALQSELNSVSDEPSDSVLDAELAELEKSVPAMERKLERLQGKGAGASEPAVSPSDVDSMQRKFNQYLQAWKQRKKAVKEMLGTISENAAKSWKEKKFCEELGVETDEQMKVKVEDFAHFYKEMKDIPTAKGKGGKAKK